MFTTVRLPLGRSRILLVLLCFIHLAGLLSVLILPINHYQRGLLIVGIAVSLVYNLKQHYFRTCSRSVRAVILKSSKLRIQSVETVLDEAPEQTWWLELNSAQTSDDGQVPQLRARLVGNYLVTPWLVLLNFKIEGRLRSFPALLFSDSTDAEQLRRLRVLLLH
ncbi:MAG: hypothetical protein P1U80_07300 [Pseudomonadales bacterium]|nr:hypothetical protein [Pseudomonadales bacterium]